MHIGVGEEVPLGEERLLVRDPAGLGVCDKQPATLLLLLVIVVYDHAHTKVQHKEAANQDEGNAHGAAHQLMVVPPWLLVGALEVYAGQHDVDPAFSGTDLEERHHARRQVIEVLVHVDPATTLLRAEAGVLGEADAALGAEALRHALLHTERPVCLSTVQTEVLVTVTGTPAGVHMGSVSSRFRAELLAAVGAPHGVVAPRPALLLAERVLGVGRASDFTNGRVVGRPLPVLPAMGAHGPFGCVLPGEAHRSVDVGCAGLRAGSRWDAEGRDAPELLEFEILERLVHAPEEAALEHGYPQQRENQKEEGAEDREVSKLRQG
mmetsp:Transcript_35112/g.100297  ORF Transcript_35112/g.100297 Transcript_35112/m.100297 type:complete len:322 (-) Transcript_35112:725-1690(-)